MTGMSLPLNNRKRTTSRFDRSDERGANLIEFALVFPIVLLVVIGIIEFAFVFAQKSEIKHLVREGARIAAVEDIGSQDITNTLCSRINLIDEGTFAFRADGADDNDADPAGSKGSIGNAAGTADLRTVTGWFDSILSGIEIESSTNFFVEAPQDSQTAWWGATPTPLNCST